MDELEIGGKKYLSSRRAAREHKYHVDYVGQLIRAGKVEGKKIGRSWYVEEASLTAYLLQEAGGKEAPQVAEAEKPVVKEVIQEESPIVVDEPEPIVVAQPEPEKITPVAAPVVEKVFEPSERVVPLHTQRNIQKVQTLTYIEDTEPMLPVLEGRVRSNADFVAVPLRRREEEPEQPTAYETPVVSVSERPRKNFLFPRMQTIAAVGFLTLAVATVASTLLVTSIKVTEGQPASVVYTIK